MSLPTDRLEWLWKTKVHPRLPQRANFSLCLPCYGYQNQAQLDAIKAFIEYRLPDNRWTTKWSDKKGVLMIEWNPEGKIPSSAVRSLAEDLEIANERWRSGEGYTGAAVHKLTYWQWMAEELISAGWKKS